MNYELFIAKRYLTAKRKQAFVSVITFISMLGITIGVMALIIALGLITGFQQDVQNKILGATSHIMVQDLTGEGLKDYALLQERIVRLPGVKSATPVAFNTVLLSGFAKSSGAVLKGVDFGLEKQQAPWLQKLEAGRLPDEESPEGAVLGSRLAEQVGAAVGDTVTVYAASTRLSPLGPLPKLRKFKVTGIFSTGLFEFDASTALVNLPAAQKYFNLAGRVSYLQVMLQDIFQAERLGQEISRLAPASVYITTWMELNKPLFSALKLEKNIIFLTITLIVIVAALNIIATLILMVMEKTRDIGILIALGATSRNIRKIFFLQGSIIGLLGTTAGVILGLGWCGLANVFKIIRVPVAIYQISYVPFHVKFADLLAIIGLSLLISLGSTWFPSRRAAKVDPVIALKYE
jgi:lipoprotein-releasing system permease protein